MMRVKGDARAVIAAFVGLGVGLVSGCSPGPVAAPTSPAAPASQVATGGQPGAPTSGSGPPAFAGGDFHLPPDPLPAGNPGDVIRVQPLDAPGLRAWRVLYHSRTQDDAAIAVSGVVLAPMGEPPAAGYPVVAWGHGTTGMADACAPSVSGVSGGGYGSQATLSGMAYLGELIRVVDAGSVVAATDYQGLGTPGLHHWMVGETAARSVLDSVRAARLIPDVGAGEDIFLYGHSQGGHAALFAGQVAPRYAPELRVRGVIAAAPAVDIRGIVDALPGSDYAGYLVMAGVSYHDAYPDAALEGFLTEAAIADAGVVETQCVGEVAEFFRPRADELLNAAWTSAEPWPSLIEANTPGGEAIQAPVLVVQGTADEQVPIGTTETGVRGLCEAGDAVEFRMYEGVDHVGVLSTAAEEIEAWARDRLAGTAPGSTCPSGVHGARLAAT